MLCKALKPIKFALPGKEGIRRGGHFEKNTEIWGCSSPATISTPPSPNCSFLSFNPRSFFSEGCSVGGNQSTARTDFLTS
jgi:hypothetical protein